MTISPKPQLARERLALKTLGGAGDPYLPVPVAFGVETTTGVPALLTEMKGGPLHQFMAWHRGERMAPNHVLLLSACLASACYSLMVCRNVSHFSYHQPTPPNHLGKLPTLSLYIYRFLASTTMTSGLTTSRSRTLQSHLPACTTLSTWACRHVWTSTAKPSGLSGASPALALILLSCPQFATFSLVRWSPLRWEHDLWFGGVPCSKSCILPIAKED